MNTPRQELKINYNSEEWVSDFDGGITSVEVDGITLRGYETWRDWIREKAILFTILLLTIGVSIGSYISSEDLNKALLESDHYKQEVIRLQYEKIERQAMLRERGVKGHLIQPEKPIGNTSAIKSPKQHIRGR